MPSPVTSSAPRISGPKAQNSGWKQFYLVRGLVDEPGPTGECRARDDEANRL